MPEQKSQTEFYGPFAHIPGRYEWCRIHSPSHGSFDTFIVIETTTDARVTVYVNSENGEAFMADRYPESSCIRVSKDDLVLATSADGHMVTGSLSASEGPVRDASMVFLSPSEASVSESDYGGESFRVWGSRWACTGVDLELKALCNGRLKEESGEQIFKGEEGVITLGSYGRIEPFGEGA